MFSPMINSFIGGRVMEIINDNNFDVLKKTGISVIDFSATWCQPCQSYTPIFENVSTEFPEIKFLKVDVDQSPKMTSFFKVRSVPTTVIIRNGEIMDDFSGLMGKNILKEKIERIR